jgi:hypothetical protein
LLRELNKQCDSGEIKDILDSITALYNEKVKQEKDIKSGPKKQTTKATLKAGKQDNKKQMISQVMGGSDDDYGEEDEKYNEDDYYDDAPKTGATATTTEKPKVKGGRLMEAEVDFM